jgi:quercetin dioxygenase-like cupin family protein
MFKTSMRAVLLCAALGAAMVLPGMVSGAEQAAVQRKVLLQQDLPIPNYQLVTIGVDFPAGSREGRHSHEGALAGYVQEGTVTLDEDGKPSKVYKAGDAFYIEPGQIHEGINNGPGPARIVATVVIEKGKTMTTPAK